MPSTSDFQAKFLAPVRIVICCLLTDCDDEEKVNIRPETLIGKLQLVEEKVGVGPRGKWVDVDDGEVIQF
ncbi:MAG TPA: hypothetical protein VFW11_01430 [Cyclobacteriaceae bacterium]|nr:hypothetical protein [Cyclobacteriaceae bacterium]